jgi:hypothetical protein
VRPARGVVGDGQRVTVLPIAELELALQVGAPQIVGRGHLGQRRALRTMARLATPLDQAVIKNRMDGCSWLECGLAVEPPDQSI